MEPPHEVEPTQAVVYVRGAPSTLADRMSNAILQARPGVLIVVAQS